MHPLARLAHHQSGRLSDEPIDCCVLAQSAQEELEIMRSKYTFSNRVGWAMAAAGLVVGATGGFMLAGGGKIVRALVK